jgi:fibrillarin-like pre-rRNA processing protein
MKKSKIFEVYEDKGRIYTVNLVRGKTVYGEKLVSENNVEYREWDPKRSKLAAAIMKGATNIGIRKGDIVLYLGASYGTTASHVSDIVGKEGFVFALDFAPRVIRDLVFVCEDRKNITPIFEDANRPDKYFGLVSSVDVVYMDIAQRAQAEIFLKNCEMFLKKDGYALIAVKARSIDVTRKPAGIFEEVKKKISEKLSIIDSRRLEPFEMDHMMFICKK